MDRNNDKALHHQQQHTYSPLHSPGQQQQSTQQQQPGYLPPHHQSQLSGQPHISQIQPEPHLHLLQHASTGNAPIQDSWNQPDSSRMHSQQQQQQQQQQEQQHQQQQQQPRSSSHYGTTSDPIFKGATEHLLSAVQQQWDSMRDHESSDTPRSPEHLISEHVRHHTLPPGRDNPHPEDNPNSRVSEESPATSFPMRLSRANTEERELPNNGSMTASEYSRSAADSDNNSRSAEDQQQTDNDYVEDDSSRTLQQLEPATSSSSTAATAVVGDPIEHEADTSRDHVSTSESSQERPTLYNTPQSNNDVTEDQNQSQSTGSKQTESSQQPDSEKEKGVVWQSLFIGGKMVKYKVLGNVKVHKGSPAAAKKPVSPKATCVNKRELPLVKLKDIGKKFKIVKVLSGPSDRVTKERREPSNAAASSKKTKTKSVQDFLGKPVPAKPHRSGRPRTPGSRLTKSVKKTAGDGTLGSIASPVSTNDTGDLPASEWTVRRESPDEEDCLKDETVGKTSRRKRSVGSVSNRTKDKRARTTEDAAGDDSDESDPEYSTSTKTTSQRIKKKSKHRRKKIKVESVPERRSSRKKKPIKKEPLYFEEDTLSNSDPEEESWTHDSEEHLMIDSLKDISNSEPEDNIPRRTKKERKKKFEKSSIVTRWPYQEIKPLVGFILSAKKAGVFKKEWPTIRENESFWERAADCCNVVRIGKKKRTGTACAHWTHCYLKYKFTTTAQMNYHFNCAESKSKEYSASHNQYETCKCYKPPVAKDGNREKRCRSKPIRGNSKYRNCSVQATAHSSPKETQTTVSTVSVSNGLKDFVSMLSATDALEVADLALHYALKEKNLFNVADNFLELCVGAFGVLQKYRQTNVIEEFARVIGTRRDDKLPRMQPDKMPFAMIAYNIRYFNNTSPFGLTVPIPYAEWLHSMYNIFGQRFHELFEGPTPDRLEIADRHPYRSQLLNVATVSKAYLKRQTDEKDKADAEKPIPAEELQEGSQESVRRKLLMNKQGRTLRELMTDVAIPPLARRKLQQAFAIMQRTSSLTAPDNEPTCEHCGAAIPRPPKPPRKYIKRKRDRKRIKGDGLPGSKLEGIKKRRTEGTKSAQKNASRQASKSDVVQSSHQGHEAQQQIQQPDAASSFNPQLYRAPQQRSVELDRMLINAPGMTPARELPANLQSDKWIPSHPGPSHQGWAPGNHQISNVAAAVAAARGVYNANQRTVDIMWQPGQPSTGWHQGDVQQRSTPPQQQLQQHAQRTPPQMEPSTSSGVHIGQNTHSYYPLTH